MNHAHMELDSMSMVHSVPHDWIDWIGEYHEEEQICSHCVQCFRERMRITGIVINAIRMIPMRIMIS